MHAGIYEFWIAADGSTTSLFKPVNCTPAQYHGLTHDAGYGPGGVPEWEGDVEEDMPLVLAARFWAPSMWAAKQVARLVEWWHDRRRT